MAQCVVLHVLLVDADTRIDWSAIGLRPYRHEGGTLSFDVADGATLDALIDETVRWLEAHRSALTTLRARHPFADAALDFGYACRLGVHGVAVQGESIPLVLIHACASLGIRIDLSLYPAQIREEPE